MSAEQSIRAARARSNLALGAHDLAAAAREWATDVQVISSTGAQAGGHEGNAASLGRQFARRPDTRYVRTPVTIEVFAPWAVASERGEWTATWTEPDGPLEIGGTYQAQWRLIDGRWLIQGELYVPARCIGGAYCERHP